MALIKREPKAEVRKRAAPVSSVIRKMGPGMIPDVTTVMPGHGSGPHPPGTVILIPSEKAAWEKMGWKEGDPLPPDIADVIGEHVESVKRSSYEPKLPVPENTPPTEMPQTVDIFDLPPEKQREIRATLEQAKIQAEAFKDSRVMNPSVRQAMEQAEQLVIENDLNKQKNTDSPKKETEQAKLEPAQICPHCGWDKTRSQENAKISDEDKAQFVQATLGQQRFHKRISLLDGNLLVIFRSLTTRESDMAYRQIAVEAQQDANAGLTMPPGHYLNLLMAYRMAMALESIHSSVSGKIEIGTVDEIDFDVTRFPPPNTRVAAYYATVIEQVLTMESVRRSISLAFHQFQALVDQLEARSEDADFWKAIER